MSEQTPIHSWHDDIETYISEEKLRARIQELGKEITRDYQDKELCVVAILKGSFVFLADIVRTIDLPMTHEFIGISSYGDATQSSGVVKITADLSHPIEGKDVLIIEDIVDTGLTMRYLLDNFETRKPQSIKVCSLLLKPDNAKVSVDVDYVGFSIPNAFVVGYGLDLAERYRNLPFIGVFNGES